MVSLERNGGATFTEIYNIEPNSPYPQIGAQLYTGYHKEVFPIKWLNYQGKMMPGDGFAVVKDLQGAYKFDIYSRGYVQPLYFQYDRQWDNVPRAPGYYSECDNQFHPGPLLDHVFINGDFNGDGISDIIAINPKVYNLIYHERLDQNGNPWDPGYNDPNVPPIKDPIGLGDCIREYNDMDYSMAHFINLDSRITSNFVTQIGALARVYEYGDRLLTGDYNGDGKTDLLHISNGAMYVYSYNPASNYLELLWQVNDVDISPSKTILPGDYNGDGLSDIIFTTNNTTFPYSTTTYQDYFMSTGKGFVKHESTNAMGGNSSIYLPVSKNYINTYSIPTDINGDGKTDLVVISTNSFDNDANPSYVTFYPVLTVNYSPTSGLSFSGGASQYQVVPFKHFPIPVILNTEKKNHNLEIGILSDDKLHLFQYQQDIQKAKLIKHVDNNGDRHSFVYENLMSVGGSSQDIQLYQSSYAQTYPNTDLENAVGLKVVSKLSRQAGPVMVQQVFGYEDAVFNTEGLGFLGFGKRYSSNWHTDAYDPSRQFSLIVNDPELRGAPVKSFELKYPYIDASVISSPLASDGAVSVNDYISRTDMSYITQILPNKVFINIPVSTTKKNLLTGVTSQISNEFDSYYNIVKSTTTINNAVASVDENTYDNNPTAYYIGRITGNKNTLTQNGDSHTTESQITYNGFLPSQIKKRGNGTPWVTEDFTYDIFGNVTNKSITTSSGTRTVTTSYDPTGRFPITHTGSDGLTTTNTYNGVTGRILTSTNAYGQTITYSYDNWGRQTQMTDHLGKSTYTSYGSLFGGGFTITESDDQGHEKTTAYDRLGQLAATREKNVLGEVIETTIEYDVYGRPYRKSEPAPIYTGDQWEVTEYDEYGRVKKITSHNGKVTEYSYNGLSTTVNDGTKSVTTVKNPLGQTISVQDPGGTINYTYYAHGGLKSSNFNNAIQTLEYDGWGRRTKLIDPSAGQYLYEFNGFGELVKETTPKGIVNYGYEAMTGRLNSKTITGDASTNFVYQYNYNATSKLLESINLNNADGNNILYTYSYDANYRLKTATEDNLYAKFKKTIDYDAFGRTSTESFEATDKSTTRSATRSVGYTYQNGAMLEMKDLVSGHIVSKINSTTPTGQVGSLIQGNTVTNYTYDSANFPQSAVTQIIGSGNAPLMSLNYTFNQQRGLVEQRTQNGNWQENFSYDVLDRLTNFNDNNGNNNQTYDQRGRITFNSKLGNYNYNGDSYQQAELTGLNSSATAWYQSRALQEINFNAFSQPVFIKEQGKEKIDFLYNGNQQRSHMFYGSEDADKMLRPKRRHYSEDGSIEITRDVVSNTTTFDFYLGGTAYDAPALIKVVEDNSGINSNIYLLHRDYMGSILMVTDVNGSVLEKRVFDAWGEIVSVLDGNNNALPSLLLTDRGYTGHEHLQNVGIINMNGRLYDPKLHRFLSPDNYIQDPFNTQNFNRYGYVLNNPLSYTDPNGEIIVPLLIGAGVGILTNGINNLIYDRPFFKGALSSAITGGIQGAGASLIGDGVNKISGTLGKVVNQTLAHGVLSGTISVLNGGKFEDGFLAGAAGSLASWGTGVLLGNQSDTWKAIGMIAAGSLAGGIGAEISGADFWDGFRSGAISSSLNHVAHMATQEKPKPIREKIKEPIDILHKVLSSLDAIAVLDEYLKSYSGLARNPAMKALGTLGGRVTQFTGLAVSGIEWINGNISGYELTFDVGNHVASIWVSAKVGGAIGGPEGFAAGVVVSVVGQLIVKPVYKHLVKPYVIEPSARKWNQGWTNFFNQINSSIMYYK